MVHTFRAVALVRCRFQKSRRNERGVVTVFVALCSVVMLTFGAIAVDLGNARQVRREAQATADAAALSGLMDLTGTHSASNEELAVTHVKQYAYVDEGISLSAWDDCGAGTSIPSGWTAPDDEGPYGYANGDRCILIDTNDTQVRITHLPSISVKAIFGGIVGVDSINITAKATASIRPAHSSLCALCVIGSYYDGQNGDMTVSGSSGAGVAVNGWATTKNNGSLTVVSGGGIDLYNNGTSSGNLSPAPQSFPGLFADPLAGLAAPNTSGPVLSGCSGPGVYRSIPTDCTLSSGVYVITGSTHISGPQVLASSGVTFYFTCANGDGTARACNSGESGADLICTGNSYEQISAPMTGPTAGIAVFFDRNNAGTFDCRGNGTTGVTGTIYGASASLIMRGNGDCDLNSMVVVQNVTFDGNNVACDIAYNGAQNVELPYSPPALTA